MSSTSISPSRLALVIAAALVASPCLSADAEEEGSVPELAKVEVVGSRIKRVDLETSQPVFVLERADIERTGLIAVGDVLQQIVYHGISLNTRINNGGNGEVRVDLRNLGSERTLVLVNGQRWASTLDGAVDLSQIPIAIVERIEVLKDGASAIYGSDAIAGVVNITTRDRYEGAEANLYYGQFEQGDGQTESYDFTWGRNGERGSVSGNVSYQRQDPVFAGDRAISAVPTYGLPANDFFAGASSITPNGRFIVPGLVNGGIGLGGYTLIEGRSGTSPGDFRRFQAGTDSYNFAPANYLLTPQERTALYAQARYDLSEGTRFSADLLYNQRRSRQLLAPTPLFINPDFAGAQGNLGISAGNLYNPFGVDIIDFRRRFGESGGRLFAQEVDTLRAGAGLDGLLTLWDRSWSWDLQAIHTRARRDDETRGAIDLQALANALGPSFRDAQGTPHCGTPDQIVPDCVPVNLFGGSASITPEMLDYVAASALGRAEDQQTSLSVAATGDLFELPHGPLGIALGVEHRRLSGFDHPDPLALEGRLSGLNNGLATDGRYDVSEGYVELNLPLLADLPLARTLELNVAARYSDYSNFGTTTNAKAGFRWKPHDNLLLRGNWSEGFRAPSISELFLGQSVAGFVQLGDPCQPLPPEPPEPPTPPIASDVLARCAAAGVPPMFDSEQFSNVSFGGNPELRPETSVGRTLGLVYSPSWWPGFDLYLDWYRIQIDAAIGDLGAQTIINRCYVLGDPASCARITRADDGHLFLVDATLQNLTTGFETEGMDLSLLWRKDTRLGRLALRWDTAYVDYYGERGRPARLTRLADGTVLQGNSVGGGGFFDTLGGEWRIKSNVTIDWSRGAYGASITGRYLSALTEGCQHIVDYAVRRNLPELRQLCDEPDRIVDLDGDGIGDRAATHQIDENWYFDLRLHWDTPWQGALQLGVNNVFDHDPPVSRAATNSFSPAYDIPGRFWYVGYRQRF